MSSTTVLSYALPIKPRSHSAVKMLFAQLAMSMLFGHFCFAALLTQGFRHRETRQLIKSFDFRQLDGDLFRDLALVSLIALVTGLILFPVYFFCLRRRPLWPGVCIIVTPVLIAEVVGCRQWDIGGMAAAWIGYLVGVMIALIALPTRAIEAPREQTVAPFL